MKVELICLIEVCGADRRRHVDRGLAGQSPGVERRVDEMRAPWSAVAGHKKSDSGIWAKVSDQLFFMVLAEIRQDVNDAALVD